MRTLTKVTLATVLLTPTPLYADAVFDNWPWQDTVFYTPAAPRAPVSARWRYPVKAMFVCHWFFTADQRIAATNPEQLGPACTTDAGLMAASAGDKCERVLHELTGGLDGTDYDKSNLVRMHICAEQDEEGGDWIVLDGYSDRSGNLPNLAPRRPK